MKLFPPFLSTILFFLIINFILTKRNLLADPEYSSVDENLKYYRFSEEKLKKFLLDDDVFVVDTRKISKSSAGYIPKTIILPVSMFPFIFSLIPVGSDIIIITEEENKQEVIDEFMELFTYKLLGYAIFSEVTAKNDFELQVVEYNPNSNANIQEIVDRGENIIDIREMNEFKETGYILKAQLIPLSHFLTEYIKIPNNGDVYIFCKSGMRSVIGMTFAKRMGYTNRFIIMYGGINRAIEEGFPLTSFNDKKF